jgi:murein L,D-transpeptidase YcbB/YkuD
MPAPLPKALCLICVLYLFCPGAVPATPAAGKAVQSSGAGERIAREIEGIMGSSDLSSFGCLGEMICGATIIPAFYYKRGHRPAWVSTEGPLPAAFDLLKALTEARREGLDSRDYHFSLISGLLSKRGWSRNPGQPANDPVRLAELDILLTDAFLMYASHLLAGRVNPETIHTRWIAYEKSADLFSVLQKALEHSDVSRKLKALKPPHEGYLRLRRALLEYRKLAVEKKWPVIPNGPLIRKGSKDERLGSIWKRLVITGDIPNPKTDSGPPETYDSVFEAAVKRFQARHGLEADGIIGPETIRDMNVPAEDRARQIELNLERWRWLPRKLEARYIILNIADFSLDVIQDGQSVLNMRIVVGRPYWLTPVFQGKITYLVINPYWNIPSAIARNEILVKVKKDPGYLLTEKIRVFRGWEKDGDPIDPGTIDWTRLGKNNFPYRFRQDPGPRNALGRIKFMFPNKFDVYLHDTPARGLFERSARDFSHGCVRTEKPVELALYLLKNKPGWTREKLNEILERGERKVVPLNRTVPVHLLYWTAWVEENGTVHFLKDIYHRDEPLSKALMERPPVMRIDLKNRPATGNPSQQEVRP